MMKIISFLLISVSIAQQNEMNEISKLPLVNNQDMEERRSPLSTMLSLINLMRSQQEDMMGENPFLLEDEPMIPIVQDEEEENDLPFFHLPFHRFWRGGGGIGLRGFSQSRLIPQPFSAGISVTIISRGDNGNDNVEENNNNASVVDNKNKDGNNEKVKKNDKKDKVNEKDNNKNKKENTKKEETKKVDKKDISKTAMKEIKGEAITPVVTPSPVIIKAQQTSEATSVEDNGVKASDRIMISLLVCGAMLITLLITYVVYQKVKKQEVETNTQNYKLMMV